ncbi:MAG TPA: hypothetical protein VEA69_06715 [Tepidisphaeraceae bacterium]|nr:hypothetical protein [Tepidisphaeraceae bacterium]
MALDAQPAFDGRMSGTILSFLTANKFRVELDDRQVVDAVVPDHLIEEIRPFYVGPPLAERIKVEVEFRQPPAMHLIVRVSARDGWCGAPRASRR